MKREVVQGHVPTRSGPRRSKRIAAQEEHQLVVPRPYIGSNQKALDSKGPRPPISKRAKPISRKKPPSSKRAKPTSRKKPPSSKRSKPPNSVGELTKACIRLNIKPESSPAKVKTEKVYLDFNVNYFGDNLVSVVVRLSDRNANPELNNRRIKGPLLGRLLRRL